MIDIARASEIRPDWERAAMLVEIIQAGMPEGANLKWIAERLMLVSGFSYERALVAVNKSHDELQQIQAKAMEAELRAQLAGDGVEVVE